MTTAASNTAPLGASDTHVSGTNNEAKKCFINYHLTEPEFGFYTVCASLAHGPVGFLLFDGNTFHEYFNGGCSRNTAYARAHKLESLGFLIPRNRPDGKPAKKPNGKNAPTHYDVLDHDEWAKRYPGVCEKMAEDRKKMAEDRKNHQCQILTQPVPDSDAASANHCTSQSQPLVHILIPTLHPNASAYQTLPTSPVPNSGTGSFAIDFETGNPSAKARAVFPPPPVPNSGTGSLADTLAAERLALLRLGRDAKGYYDLDTGVRESTDEWMRRRKKYQERGERKGA